MKVRPRWGLLALAASSLWLSPGAHAFKTNFMDPHRGLEIGGGTYSHPLANDNLFDPVPRLAPSGTTVTGSNLYYLLPLRLGVFLEKGRIGGELYVRYMLNTTKAWTAAGTLSGSGSTKFSSVGGGGGAYIVMVRYPRFRLLTTASAEYVLQRAALTFNSEVFHASVVSVLAGVGLQPELYIGDLYSISFLAAYQYGLARYWNAAAAGTIFGQTYAKGQIASPIDGGNIKASFGGVQLELMLKLNFY